MTTRICRSFMMAMFAFILMANAFAQSPSDQVSQALAPEVRSDDLPAKFVAFGAGVKSGTASGWANVCGQIKGPAYACFAEDVIAGKTTTRAGIETVFFRHGGLFLTAKANAGVATGQSATGGAYGVGGSLLYDLTRAKAPGYFAVFSATYDYSNISDLGTAAGRGVRQALGGGTYRFGIGKRF